MHLSRIRVPEFRVLKDVDIQFEKEFTPRIFPLGSQNGGGKSTLLQLIFVLLHCSTEPSRIPYLKNMLKGFKANEEGERTLAIFDIVEGDRTVQLEFFCCQDSYINELIDPALDDCTDVNQLDSFSKTNNDFYRQPNSSDSLGKLQQEIDEIEQDLDLLTQLNEASLKLENATNLVQTQKVIESLFDLLPLIERRDRLNKTWSKDLTIKKNNSSNIDVNFIAELWKAFRKKTSDDLKMLEIQHLQIMNRVENQFWEKIKAKNILYITHYSSEDKEDNYKEALFCRIINIKRQEVNNLLNKLSNYIFLAAPSTQVFIFLSQDANKLLFESSKNSKNLINNYYDVLLESKVKLSGLFTYDFLSVEVLIDSFKTARDKDFQEAIDTEGKYGNHFKNLLNEVSHLLPNKNISPKPDLSGVTFFMNKNGEKVELYPEDLSHGELKRLSIYMWLKSRNIEDCLVLMDEIEIALHPDWQYQIVSDLTEWAPNNQYILATHSYELCQALTPAHVKELEPKLINQ